MRRLEGQAAIVTGGSRGIGRAVALELAKEGASVVVNYARNRDEALHVVEEIERLDSKAVAVAANVAVYEEAKQLADACLENFGRIDILVNNAGINRDRSFKSMTVEAWRDVIDVNLNGVFNCCHVVLPTMLAQKYGRIVNIDSDNAVLPSFGQSNYCASKAGVIGLNRTLAIEVAKSGITVNIVHPGYTETDMLATVPDDIMEKLIARIPMGRVGKPEEVAKGVMFFILDASYCTGQQLHINGGLWT